MPSFKASASLFDFASRFPANAIAVMTLPNTEPRLFDFRHADFVFLFFFCCALGQASGRELSFMLLGGILICYCNTFTLLAKPMLLTCAVQRLSVGTGFSIVYGALFTKTNRISRIFDSVLVFLPAATAAPPSGRRCNSRFNFRPLDGA